MVEFNESIRLLLSFDKFSVDDVAKSYKKIQCRCITLIYRMILLIAILKYFLIHTDGIIDNLLFSCRFLYTTWKLHILSTYSDINAIIPYILPEFIFHNLANLCIYHNNIIMYSVNFIYNAILIFYIPQYLIVKITLISILLFITVTIQHINESEFIPFMFLNVFYCVFSIVIFWFYDFTIKSLCKSLGDVKENSETQIKNKG